MTSVPPSPHSSIRSDRPGMESFRPFSTRYGPIATGAGLHFSMQPRLDAGRVRRHTSSMPHNPDWLKERPYMSLEYLRSAAQINSSISMNTRRDSPSTAQISPSVQELLLTEDLLFAMMGIEGKYIRATIDEGHGGVKFSIDPDIVIDQSLVTVTSKVLPLCHSYVRVGIFVDTYSRYECGMVNHALCAAMRSLLQDYYVFIAQLETQFRNGKLNLQRLLYYVQPCISTLTVIDRVAEEISKHQTRGGATLNKIIDFARKHDGDPRSRDICHVLLQKSSVPFFEMISSWVYKGFIKDPYDEFMIEEHGEYKKDLVESNFNEAESYWDQRYVLRQDFCPSFLSKIANEILTTGKYLNVIRECGRDIGKEEQKIQYSVNEKEYIEQIEAAFQFASAALLDLLLNEMQLLPRLRSIKHYFLLDQGDFLVHFLDISEKELQKPISEIDTTKFESLLDLSIRSSVSVSDPFRDDVVCDFLSYSLVRQLMIMHTNAQNLRNPTAQRRAVPNVESPFSQTAMSATAHGMTGFEAFTFDYKVRWPVSLVINRRALIKYQLIFRNLFQCKYIERRLCESWIDHNYFREINLRAQFGKSYGLRQRMLHFVQSLQYYLLFEVLEPNWRTMEEKIGSVTKVDEVLKYHTDFLDSSLTQCLLNIERVIRVLSSILATCKRFADYITVYMQNMNERMLKILEIHEIQAKASAPQDPALRAHWEMKKQILRRKSLAAGLQEFTRNQDHRLIIEEIERAFDSEVLDLIKQLTISASTMESDPKISNLITLLKAGNTRLSYPEL